MEAGKEHPLPNAVPSAAQAPVSSVALPQEAVAVTKEKSSSPAETTRIDAVEETLGILARSLPRSELRLVIQESDECEKSLLQDIALLERMLPSDGVKQAGDERNLQAHLESLFTPLDRFWTASGLLGRLRDDLAVPSIVGFQALSTSLQVRNGARPALADLQQHAGYTAAHASTQHLLTTWKRISSHRSALVFRKPVKPEEAPGYAARILFPMDLSQIKRMILARQVVSYADLHRLTGLISYNCVKYNGRESDYGVVARDFEAAAETCIRQAILQPTDLPEGTTSA
jgi:Bromodomain